MLKTKTWQGYIICPKSSAGKLELDFETRMYDFRILADNPHFCLEMWCVINIQGCTVFTHTLAFFFSLKTYKHLKRTWHVLPNCFPRNIAWMYTLSILFHKFLFPDTGSESVSFFGVSFTERNYTNAFVANLGGY